ncbi:PAS domain-containing protein [Paracoccus laeviglucosivorans]|uniref:histidine kinase n=1 Tax=Paracoccus laeviglucosivorans TaxID=1197861 RepID=A0A521CXH7_9RHOB|nr:PAS domain-containing protein [Paracoccus laeviglucosivorans]SMO64128.1 PAS domain S-box-containing protein [Paracoccus laeviglucosivorans]
MKAPTTFERAYALFPAQALAALRDLLLRLKNKGVTAPAPDDCVWYYDYKLYAAAEPWLPACLSIDLVVEAGETKILSQIARRDRAVSHALIPQEILDAGLSYDDGTPFRHELRGEIAVHLGRKNKTDKLSPENSNYDVLFSCAPFGVFEVTISGRFRRVNQVFCQMVGRKSAELLRTSAHDITHPEDLDHRKEAIERALRSSRSVSFKKRYIRPDGVNIWVNNTLTVLRDHNERPEGLVTISSDFDN